MYIIDWFYLNFRQYETFCYDFSYIVSSAVLSFPQPLISTPALCLLTFFWLAATFYHSTDNSIFIQRGREMGLVTLWTPAGRLPKLIIRLRRTARVKEAELFGLCRQQFPWATRDKPSQAVAHVHRGSLPPGVEVHPVFPTEIRVLKVTTKGVAGAFNLTFFRRISLSISKTSSQLWHSSIIMPSLYSVFCLHSSP